LREWKNSPPLSLNGDNIDEIYPTYLKDNDIYDAIDEIRQGETETNIPPPYSRHYESKSVASKALDGTWIGWTYYYGGGKHGQPGEVEWIEHAYNLTCTEEEKVVTIRIFSKAP
jgi:hypothetical protein